MNFFISHGVSPQVSVGSAAMENGKIDLKQVSMAHTLQKCPLFSNLPQDDVKEILNFSVIKSVDKGEYLFREGDACFGFYVIQKGVVSVHRLNEATGKEHVIHMFRAGESFGEGGLAVSSGYPADARAVEPTQLVLIQKNGFLDLLGRRPDLAVGMLAVMSHRLRMLLSQLEDLTLKDVDCRLAAWLIRQCPDPTSKQAHTIALTFTKKVLASELGTVSATLSRTFGHLHERELITVKGKQITVTSPAKLNTFLHDRLGD